MPDRKRILVADDDRFVRESLRLILTSAGYEVAFAENGEAAVKMAADQQPDLVLTDGLLPKLHGFEVCKRIKLFENPPKVVIFTGVYTKPTYKYQLMTEYKADAVLFKPIDVSKLLSCINQLLTIPFEQPAVACVAGKKQATFY